MTEHHHCNTTHPQKCMEAWLGPVAVDNSLFGFLEVVDEVWINLAELCCLNIEAVSSYAKQSVKERI